jgi:Bacterial conjugation TrbI-like protein
MIGVYDSQVSFGQSRVLLVWTRLIMPNGRSIVLERQPGADTAGYAGWRMRSIITGVRYSRPHCCRRYLALEANSAPAPIAVLAATGVSFSAPAWYER